MSSNGHSVPAPTADDNLVRNSMIRQKIKDQFSQVTRAPKVKSDIATIKDKKQKILATLQQLSKEENVSCNCLVF